MKQATIAKVYHEKKILKAKRELKANFPKRTETASKGEKRKPFFKSKFIKLGMCMMRKI